MVCTDSLERIRELIRRQRQGEEELSSVSSELAADDVVPARKIALGPRLSAPVYRGLWTLFD